MEPIEQHSIIAPSSAYRIVECPGSVKAQRDFPQEESSETKEGTASHWVGTSVLKSYMAERPLMVNSFINKAAPNGIIVSDEMAEGAQVYVNIVLKTVQEYGLLQMMHVEERVDIPQVHSECWGTPDTWAANLGAGRLHIWDYKYGHRFVDEYENWQLICYALGALKAAWPKYDGIVDQNIEVVMTVVQPRYYRADTTRSWTIKASDLRGYANRLKASAGEVFYASPGIHSGPHCRDCTVRHSCEGAQKAAMASVDISQQLNLVKYSADALGTEIDILRRAKKAVTDRLDGLETEALIRYKKGELIPGYAGKEKCSRQNWIRPVAEVVALGDIMGVDLRKAPAVITPTQAIKKGVDESVIKQYSGRQSAGIELVKDNGRQAKKVFG